MLSRVSLVCLLVVAAVGIASADQPTQTMEPELRTLNGHFPFSVPQSPEAWNERADELRRRVLVSTGLWPMPDRPAITPVTHGKIHRDGFTVERIYFESLPGHYVSGLLFRPDGESALKRPGVLSPHGHGGRMMRLDDGELKKQLDSGGEIHERSGRYPKLARCAHLARMGCVAMIFDMIGYGDSNQIAYEVAHRHAKPRPEETDREQPCFFSIDADLNLQSIMGLQTWNALRAMDVLAALPDVDENRLGVTGGSGGGTQSILLGAIDPRIKVSFPNGMVSTSMQGGCYCENCNYLRLDAGNVELAALFAPRPQGMTAADDWTKDMMTDGYPELQQLYKMLGQPENVMCRSLLQFPHNYNYVTRATMYPWMKAHLGLPGDAPEVEQDFEPLTEAEMTVWNDQHPAPTQTGVAHERAVLAWWKKQSETSMAGLIPDLTDDGAPQNLNNYQRVVGAAWRTIFDRSLPELADLDVDSSGKESALTTYKIRHPEWKVGLSAYVIPPPSGNSRRTVLMPIAKVGPADFLIPNAAKQVMQELYGDEDTTVVILQLANKQRLIDDERTYSAFTFGYNRTLTATQCDQLLCSFAVFAPAGDQELSMLAGGDCVGATAAAAVIAGPSLANLRIDTSGFRFGGVKNYRDPGFVPGAVKYGDLPGLLSLRAPYPLTVTGEEADALALVQKAYDAAGAGTEFKTSVDLER